MDINTLVRPLSESCTCGLDVRHLPEARALYYSLKDARNSARTAERSLAVDEPVTVVPFWNDVNSSAFLILSEYSKDLEVLCWLVEAQLRLNGFSGLNSAFAVIASLIEDHWPDIHSVADDTTEDRVAPLTGLNGRGNEGVLIQALRLTPLIPGYTYGKFGLWDYQCAQRIGETFLHDTLYRAVTLAGKSAMERHLAEVESCLEHFTALNLKLDLLCGADAPPQSNIRQVLKEAAAAIRDMANIGHAAEKTGIETLQNSASADTQSVVPALRHNQECIGSREEAFEDILRIAQFFRKAEPHSPMALALETLVRRGRMNFQQLLSELLPDPTIRASVLTAAGIQPTLDALPE